MHNAFTIRFRWNDGQRWAGTGTDRNISKSCSAPLWPLSSESAQGVTQFFGMGMCVGRLEDWRTLAPELRASHEHLPRTPVLAQCKCLFNNLHELGELSESLQLEAAIAAMGVPTAVRKACVKQTGAKKKQVPNRRVAFANPDPSRSQRLKDSKNPFFGLPSLPLAHLLPLSTREGLLSCLFSWLVDLVSNQPFSVSNVQLFSSMSRRW